MTVSKTTQSTLQTDSSAFRKTGIPESQKASGRNYLEMAMLIYPAGMPRVFSNFAIPSKGDVITTPPERGSRGTMFIMCMQLEGRGGNAVRKVWV